MRLVGHLKKFITMHGNMNVNVVVCYKITDIFVTCEI